MTPQLTHLPCELHAVRLDQLEQRHKEATQATLRVEDKVDGLKGWIMAALLASLIAAFGAIGQLLVRR